MSKLVINKLATKHQVVNGSSPLVVSKRSGFRIFVEVLNQSEENQVVKLVAKFAGNDALTKRSENVEIAKGLQRVITIDGIIGEYTDNKIEFYVTSSVGVPLSESVTCHLSWIDDEITSNLGDGYVSFVKFVDEIDQSSLVYELMSNGFVGSGTPVQAPPNDWSVEKKAQYYLAHMGFNIGTDTKGDPLIDGDWGNRSRIAAIMLQDWNRTTVTAKADTQTLVALEEFNRMGVAYDDIYRDFIPSNYQVTPLEKNKWGHLTETELQNYIIIDTRYDNEWAYINPVVAIAWANMAYTGHKDGIPIDYFYPSYHSGGYRHYPDQVRLYAKEYLKLPGWTDAATPVFDDGLTAANNHIKAHEEEFKLDKHFFQKNDDIGPVGSNKKLSGRGGSWHGNGTAIDLGTADPGSKSGGKGYATTEQVKWLEGISTMNESGKSAKDFGFHPYLDRYNPYIKVNGVDVNNYAETWHMNYKGHI